MGKVYYSLLLILFLLPLGMAGGEQYPINLDVSTLLSINGDTELVSFATSENWDVGGRDGTKGNPYLITGYSFGDTETYTGLSFSATTLYVNVTSNIFDETSVGITLTNVHYMTIHNNVLDSINTNVLKTSGFSDYVNISSNTFHRYPGHALDDVILMDQVTYHMLWNNSFLFSGPIVLNSASQNKVFNNQFSMDNDGIEILGGTGNEIYDNEFISVRVGSTAISLSTSATDVLISNNTIKFSGEKAIELRNCDNVRIENNDIEMTWEGQQEGIYIYNSLNTEITNNTILTQGDSVYGIQSVGSAFIFIGGNEIHATRFSIHIDGTSFDYLYNNNLWGSVFIKSRNYNGAELSEVTNNTVNGLPLLNLNREADMEVTGTYGQIIITNSERIDLHDVIIPGSDNGLMFYNSNNNTIRNSSFTVINGSLPAIRFYYSAENNITDNTMIGGGLTFEGGADLWAYTQDTVTGNLINGLPLIYNYNNNNTVISDPVGQVVVLKSENVTIVGINFLDVSMPVEIIHAVDITIAGNTFRNFDRAIYLETVSGVNILYNSISNGQRGIDSKSFNQNNDILILGNEISYVALVAIYFWGVNTNHIVKQNYIHDTIYWTLLIQDVKGLDIVTNEFNNIKLWTPIYFISGNEDVNVKWNNFHDDTAITGSELSFDISNNYFSSYTDADVDGDGIWDNPYDYFGIQDPTPLVNPYTYEKPVLSISQSKPGFIDVSWVPSKNNYNNSFSSDLFYSKDGISWISLAGDMTEVVTSFEFDVSGLSNLNFMFKLISTAESFTVFDISEEFVYDPDFVIPTTEPTEPTDTTDVTTATTPSSTTSDEGGIGANFFFGLFVIAIPILRRKSKKIYQ